METLTNTKDDRHRSRHRRQPHVRAVQIKYTKTIKQLCTDDTKKNSENNEKKKEKPNTKRQYDRRAETVTAYWTTLKIIKHIETTYTALRKHIVWSESKQLANYKFLSRCVAMLPATGALCRVASLCHRHLLSSSSTAVTAAFLHLARSPNAPRLLVTKYTIYVCYAHSRDNSLAAFCKKRSKKEIIAYAFSECCQSPKWNAIALDSQRMASSPPSCCRVECVCTFIFIARLFKWMRCGAGVFREMWTKACTLHTTFSE